MTYPTVLEVSHKLDIHYKDNDLIRLQLDSVEGTIRGQITGNGKTHYMVQVNSKVNAVSYFMGAEPEAMAAKFDQTGTVANKIDGLQLVEHLKEHLSKMPDLSDDERSNLSGQIDRLSVAHNLMALHAVGFNTMTLLYGFNWVAEQSHTLIRKSQEWLDLVERVSIAQEHLKGVLSS